MCTSGERYLIPNTQDLSSDLRGRHLRRLKMMRLNQRWGGQNSLPDVAAPRLHRSILRGLPPATRDDLHPIVPLLVHFHHNRRE